MLRWAVAYAIDRLLILLIVLIAMKALGVSTEQIETHFREAFTIASPFEEVINALK